MVDMLILSISSVVDRHNRRVFATKKRKLRRPNIYMNLSVTENPSKLSLQLQSSSINRPCQHSIKRHKPWLLLMSTEATQMFSTDTRCQNL